MRTAFNSLKNPLNHVGLRSLPRSLKSTKSNILFCNLLTLRVGVLLSRYKSGKLPKAFKIIPSCENWETILMLTSPGNWTPHATYEATRLFVSNLDANQAQRFVQTTSSANS